MSIEYDKEYDNHLCYKIIKESNDENEIIEKIKKNFNEIKNDNNFCIEYLLLTSNYNALKLYINYLSKEGIKFRETLKNSIDSIEKKLNEIYNKYKFKKEEYQIVSPAVKWAQSLSDIYLQIKFSHRHDSPGCLEVHNLTINIYNNTIFLSAECILADVPIKFLLNYTCLYNFEKKMNDFKQGSVGKIELKIKKEKNVYWDRLLLNENEIPNNLKIWYEMKEKYDGVLKKFQKNLEPDDDLLTYEEIEEKIKKERKNNKKTRKNKKNIKVVKKM